MHRYVSDGYRVDGPVRHQEALEGATVEFVLHSTVGTEFCKFRSSPVVPADSVYGPEAKGSPKY